VKLALTLAGPAAALRRVGPRLSSVTGGWADRTLTARSGTARWWHDRTTRERWLIGLLLAVAAVVVVERLVWHPLVLAKQNALIDLARYDRIAAQLRAAGPDVARIAAARNGTLSTVVTERAGRAGLTIARIEPQGVNVAVSFDGVGFDALIDWLAALDRDAGISIVDLKVDRRPDPGVVTAQVTLTER